MAAELLVCCPGATPTRERGLYLACYRAAPFVQCPRGVIAACVGLAGAPKHAFGVPRTSHTRGSRSRSRSSADGPNPPCRVGEDQRQIGPWADCEGCPEYRALSRPLLRP